MRVDCEHEILMVLDEVGAKGMPLRRIALNVFNMRNSLFEPLSKEKMYDEVASYLHKESTLSGSPVRRMEKRGWYRINPRSVKVRQMRLEFKSEDAD